MSLLKCCFGFSTSPVHEVKINFPRPPTPPISIRVHSISSIGKTTLTGPTPSSTPPLRAHSTPDDIQQIQDLLQSELVRQGFPAQIQTMKIWPTGICKIVFFDGNVWYRKMQPEILKDIIKELVESRNYMEISVPKTLVQRIPHAVDLLQLNNTSMRIKDIFPHPGDASHMIILLESKPDKKVLYAALSALSEFSATKDVKLEKTLEVLRQAVGFMLPKELVSRVDTNGSTRPIEISINNYLVPTEGIFSRGEQWLIVLKDDIKIYQIAIHALISLHQPALDETIDDLRSTITPGDDVKITVPVDLIKAVACLLILKQININGFFNNILYLPNRRKVYCAALEALKEIRTPETSFILPAHRLEEALAQLCQHGLKDIADRLGKGELKSILAPLQLQVLEDVLAQLDAIINPKPLHLLHSRSSSDDSILSSRNQLSATASNYENKMPVMNDQAFYEKYTPLIGMLLRSALKGEKGDLGLAIHLFSNIGVCEIDLAPKDREHRIIHRKISAENLKLLRTAQDDQRTNATIQTIVQDILAVRENDCLEISIPVVLLHIREKRKVVYFRQTKTELPIYDVFPDPNNAENRIVLFKPVVFEALRVLKVPGWKVPGNILKLIPAATEPSPTTTEPSCFSLGSSADLGVAHHSLASMARESKLPILEVPSLCQPDPIIMATKIGKIVATKVNEKLQEYSARKYDDADIIKGIMYGSNIQEVRLYPESDICKILRKDNTAVHRKIGIMMTLDSIDAIVENLLNQPPLVEVAISKEMAAQPHILAIENFSYRSFEDPENNALQILHFYPQEKAHQEKLYIVLKDLANREMVKISPSDLDSIPTLWYIVNNSRPVVMQESGPSRNKSSSSLLPETPVGGVNSLIVRS